MQKKKELIKNTLIILLGKICTQFLSFILLPLYTSVLGSGEYGTVDLITTYITLAVPIITLQIETALFREIIDARKDDNKKTTIISSGICSIFFQFIICLIIYLIINLIIDIPFNMHILFVVICTMTSNILLQISRGNGDNVGYSIASVIAGISTILFNILFLIILDLKIEGMLLSIALGNLLATIYLFIRCNLYTLFNVKNISKEQIKCLIRYSLPLVPNGLIWWIINASDRTLITIFLGTSANGIYAVANKFSNILIQVFNVFNLSWTESASIHINDTDKDIFFSDIFNAIIKLFTSICISLISMMPFIFPIMVNKEFYESYTYIPLLLVGMMFNIIVSFIGSIYVALKKTKEVAKTSLWASILNIVINLCLIKTLGIHAAVISTILSFLIMSIYRYIDVQRYVSLKINYKMLLQLITVLLLVIITYYINKTVISILTCVLVIICLMYINKDIISKIRGILAKSKK